MKKLVIEVEQAADGDNIVSSPIITKISVNDRPIACVQSFYLLVSGNVVHVTADFDDDAMSLQNAHRFAVLPFVEAKVLLSVPGEYVDAEKD